MPRSLKAVTGERPRSQYSDKPLRPDTDTIEVRSEIRFAIQSFRW
jgi:hypothetical protein